MCWRSLNCTQPSIARLAIHCSVPNFRSPRSALGSPRHISNMCVAALSIFKLKPQPEAICFNLFALVNYSFIPSAKSFPPSFTFSPTVQYTYSTHYTSYVWGCFGSHVCGLLSLNMRLCRRFKSLTGLTSADHQLFSYTELYSEIILFQFS